MTEAEIRAHFEPKIRARLAELAGKPGVEEIRSRLNEARLAKTLDQATYHEALSDLNRIHDRLQKAAVKAKPRPRRRFKRERLKPYGW